MLTKKLNNNTKYKGMHHKQPCHLASFRKQEAKERQAEYDKLTIQQKLDRLPADHCEKQRKRLTALLNKEVSKPSEQLSEPVKV